MQREIVFLRQEFTTRRYAFIWISVWLILLFATWFSRPLLPFQETLFSGIVWELYQSGDWLYPSINEVYQHSVYPLNYWISLMVWEIFGVSEFSLRVVASFFSLGTLFLTAWAAYQLWPDKRNIRANAPLVLIGSLMWTVFATANVEYVYFTFYLMLTVNFLIRVWRFKQNVWWVAFTLSLTLGLYSGGLSFLFVVLSIIVLAPYWSRNRWKEIYAYGGVGILISLALFFVWALIVTHTYNISLFDALGFRYILKAFVQFPPLYIYVINLMIVLFPWLFWLRLYRLYRIVDRDSSLRFVEIWFFSLVITLGILSLTSLEALLPIYPAFALIVARIYQPGFSRKRDVLPIVLFMMMIGLLMIIVPYNYIYFNLPEWVGRVSPFWGAGLLLFGITLIFNASHTRIMTLALMSIALTLAMNFGVVRVATDFYDLKPVGERLSWYQSQSIPVGHADSYRGHLHFVGKLKDPLVEVGSLRDLLALKEKSRYSRVILYVENYSQFGSERVEYWQPFRGKYLVIMKVDSLLDFIDQKGIKTIEDIL
ncbi:ArnT family glycosyltransferase [Ignatzschineria sp. LJL83]